MVDKIKFFKAVSRKGFMPRSGAWFKALAWSAVIVLGACSGSTFTGGANAKKSADSTPAAIPDTPTDPTTPPPANNSSVNTDNVAGSSQACTTGCCPSQKIALVDCTDSSAPNIKPGDFSVTPVSCAVASGSPDALNGYDTIVYYGLTSLTGGKLPAAVDAALNGGAKVIASMPGLSGVIPFFYDMVMEIAIEYLSNIGGSTIQIHNPNTMTAAFHQQTYAAANITYFMRFGLNPDSRWCSDIIATSALAFQTTTAHAYLLDSPTRKGLAIFSAMSIPNGQTGFDFTEPFMAAQLSQKWDRAGDSAACGLTCSGGNSNIFGGTAPSLGSNDGIGTSNDSIGSGGGNHASPSGNGFTTATGVGKPIIYLYPTEDEDIAIKLDFTGKLVTTYPKFDPAIGGWKVHANPQGQLVDLRDRREYSYIYWNGETNAFKPSFDEGFVVKGVDSRHFLQEKLAALGLSPRESNDMIVYWLPYLEKNPFNLIHFAHEEYTSIAKLEIVPKPDSLLRVFLVFKGINQPTTVKPQTLEPFQRKGFSVVEWGGTEIGGSWHIIH